MFQCIFQNYLKTECVRRSMAITNDRRPLPQTQNLPPACGREVRRPTKDQRPGWALLPMTRKGARQCAASHPDQRQAPRAANGPDCCKVLCQDACQNSNHPHQKDAHTKDAHHLLHLFVPLGRRVYFVSKQRTNERGNHEQHRFFYHPYPPHNVKRVAALSDPAETRRTFRAFALS